VRRAHRRGEDGGAPIGRYNTAILNPATHTDAVSRLPAWARGADVLTLALLAAGLLVAAFGGIRLRLFDARLSLTSPWRALGWAAVVAVARHGLVREQPLYRRLIDALRTGVRSTPFRVAWPICVATRLSVLLVGYFAVVTIGYPVPDPPNRSSYNEFLNLPSRWDTGWYFGIATYGYSWDAKAKPTDQQNIVFFPAYPLLMRAVGRLLDSRLLLAGMLVSFASFFVALMYLYGLARQWLEHEQAVTALWLLAAYPFAVFFSAAYTEALYLCGVAGAFSHFHRREFARAGLWGLLVGLTRPNGCFLSVPLAVLALGAVRRADGKAGSGTRRWSALAAAALPGVGMILYSVFVYRLAGDPLAWARGHSAWGRQYAGLSGGLANSFALLANGGIYSYTATIPFDLLNAVPALFALGMSWLVFKRFGLAYALFLWLALIPPMLAGGLLSVGRFTSVIFPAFFGLALLVSVRARPAWVAAFAMGQALAASLFFTWRPLF
jgi:hypothetical protein